MADGDEVAIAHLYDVYSASLYAFGLRRLGTTELAEQLVQDVMTRLWRTADAYDGARGSVRTWIFTMARSTAIDLYRRSPQRTAAIDADAVPDDDVELDRVMDAELVRAALDRLGDEHREVLELAYFRGLSQREIANRLALPIGTVKSRTYYALRAFSLACDELGVTR